MDDGLKLAPPEAMRERLEQALRPLDARGCRVVALGVVVDLLATPADG